MRPDAPYFIILLCVMPDVFTVHGKSAATQWVKYINKNKIKQHERTAVFNFFGEKSKPFLYFYRNFSK